jgi:hypothetical protein
MSSGPAGGGAVERGRVPATRPANFGPPDALRTIVTAPRATMRWLLDHGDGGLWLLLLLGALVALAAPMAIDAAQAFARPPLSFSAPWFVIVFAVGLCAIGALFFLCGAAIAARVLGGVGRPGEAVRAIAWGGLPLVAVLPFVLASGFLDPSRTPRLVALLRLLVFIAALASCGIALFTFAEAQRFSWRRSAVALLLAVVLAYVFGLVTWPLLPALLLLLTGGVH